MDNRVTFRQLLGENLAQLSFEERQAIAQCLVSPVVVTGEAVDIHFVLPFASTPQVARRLPKEPEGTPGHFYRLRLAHFDGIPVVAASRGQKMPLKLLGPVRKRRGELVRPMDTTTIDHHDDLCPNATKDRYHLMAILAKSLGIKMGDDFRETFGGAVLDSTNHTEPHATRHTTPGVIACPRETFAGLLGPDLTPAQRACRQAIALRCAPPTCTREGKAP